MPRVGVLGARADALDKADALGLGQVAGPAQVAFQRAARGDQPLELHAGDDVGKAGVAVLVQGGGVVDVHAGGDDDRAHLEVEQLVLHVEVDAVLFAGLDALAAGDGVLAQALVGG